MNKLCEEDMCEKKSTRKKRIPIQSSVGWENLKTFCTWMQLQRENWMGLQRETEWDYREKTKWDCRENTYWECFEGIPQKALKVSILIVKRKRKEDARKVCRNWEDIADLHKGMGRIGCGFSVVVNDSCMCQCCLTNDYLLHHRHHPPPPPV